MKLINYHSPIQNKLVITVVEVVTVVTVLESITYQQQMIVVKYIPLKV